MCIKSERQNSSARTELRSSYIQMLRAQVKHYGNFRYFECSVCFFSFFSIFLATNGMQTNRAIFLFIYRNIFRTQTLTDQSKRFSSKRFNHFASISFHSLSRNLTKFKQDFYFHLYINFPGIRTTKLSTSILNLSFASFSFLHFFNKVKARFISLYKKHLKHWTIIDQIRRFWAQYSNIHLAFILFFLRFLRNQTEIKQTDSRFILTSHLNTKSLEFKHHKSNEALRRETNNKPEGDRR